MARPNQDQRPRSLPTAWRPLDQAKISPRQPKLPANPTEVGPAWTFSSYATR